MRGIYRRSEKERMIKKKTDRYISSKGEWGRWGERWRDGERTRALMASYGVFGADDNLFTGQINNKQIK